MQSPHQSEHEETYLATYATSHPVYSRPNAVSSKGRRSQIRSFLVRHLKKSGNARLLDLGCGDGTLLDVARELSFEHAEGVDLSPQMVKLAKGLGLNVTYQDVLSFLEKQPTASVEFVSAFDLLEHLDQEKLFNVCKNVHRILSDGGKFLIHVPNGASPYVGRVRYGDITHERAFTRESLQQVLRSVGFGKILAEEDEPVPTGLVSLTRLVLWRLVRQATIFRLAVETGHFRGYILTLNMFVVGQKL